MDDLHSHKVRAKAAKIMRRDRADYDDIVQEGLIAFWKTHDGTEENVGLAMRAATLRMRHALASAPQRPFQPTGREPMPGHTAPSTMAILDRPISTGSGGTLADLMLPSIDPPEGAALAYHQQEITDALLALSQEDRSYVFRRFWEGMTNSEIAREDGVGTSTIHNRWTRRVYPALLGSLGHLRSA